MSKKIDAFTELATIPANTDLFLLELASSGAYRKIKYSNLIPTGALVQEVGNTSTAVATGTTVVPNDDTIPQNTEGDQYMTQAITPVSATNILEFEILLLCSSSVPNTMIAALFQDTTASAIAVAAQYVNSATVMTMVKLVYRVAAGTTSATTFKVRLGGDSAGTTTFNGISAARKFGAISKSSMIIREIKA